ncbi:MAG: CsgG/HfaB family protein [Fibromonadaceae bacterium]|jgi:hypothetical protein|nr:CsgG/HfaB family protein [Fibromonadaceae bacterium]
MKKFIFSILVFCAIVFGQDNKIAVYVTGEIGANEKKALSTKMLTAFVNSGKYRAIERSDAFINEIAREQEKQRSGAIDDDQISRLGKQFGVQFVCIADVTFAFNTNHVSARIIDVETAEVVAIGEAESPLKTMADLDNVSNRIIRNMFGGAKIRGFKDDNFTVGERFQTFVFNVIPGAGSLAVMDDWTGAIVSWSLVGGFALINTVAIGRSDYTDKNFLEGALIGLLVNVTLWNVIRTTTYDKPKPENTAHNMQSGFNVGILPNRHGEAMPYLMYNKVF